MHGAPMVTEAEAALERFALTGEAPESHNQPEVAAGLDTAHSLLGRFPSHSPSHLDHEGH
jgi:hypothetical protein